MCSWPENYIHYSTNEHSRKLIRYQQCTICQVNSPALGTPIMNCSEIKSTDWKQKERNYLPQFLLWELTKLLADLQFWRRTCEPKWNLGNVPASTPEIQQQLLGENMDVLTSFSINDFLSGTTVLRLGFKLELFIPQGNWWKPWIKSKFWQIYCLLTSFS